jgi:hypothetical protein
MPFRRKVGNLYLNGFKYPEISILRKRLRKIFPIVRFGIRYQDDGIFPFPAVHSAAQDPFQNRGIVGAFALHQDAYSENSTGGPDEDDCRRQGR